MHRLPVVVVAAVKGIEAAALLKRNARYCARFVASLGTR